MKQRILLLAAIILSARSMAQPVITGGGNQPVKFSDVVAAYEKNKVAVVREEEKEHKGRSKEIEEGEDYHFDRWKWYWQQHTDDNGYLVSPVRNYEEWLKQGKGNTAGKSTATNTSNWSFQGPSNSGGGYEGIGRISSIEFHPTDTNTYWIAAAGGGIWKTTNDGINWTCLTDLMPIIGSSDVDVNPLNPNTIYWCPGDRDASDSYSPGVMKSTDGGQTWNATGMTYTASQLKLTNCLVINRMDTNSLTVATSDGLYKSYNGGTTWSQKQAGNFKQVLYHPTDTNVLYAARYGNPIAFFRSANGGSTWTQITSFTAQRIVIAVTPANVGIVRFIAANTANGLEGIYNSNDTGKTFTKIFSGGTSCQTNFLSSSMSGNSCGGQGWYDLSLAISPVNTNLMIAGGVNSWYSTNGGTGWTIANQWWSSLPGVAEVHADKHYQAFQPTRPDMLFECNDGGLYKSSSIAGGIWNDMTNGMGITQFYRNAVASNATFVLGGAQDNGTKHLQNGVSSFVEGGDGMNCEIDYADSNTIYASVQYGDIMRFSSTLGDAQISNNIPGTPTGPWITPYVISPFNHLHLIAGYKQLYFSDDAGDSWYSITPTPLNSSKNVLRIAMTPAKDSTIYAVLESSNIVYYTHTFYPGATPAFSSVTAPVSGNISDIKVDPKDKTHFWISFTGYNTNRVYEYKSGVWSNFTNGLASVPVGCLEIDSSNGTLYAGTDLGVYFYDTASPAQWKSFSTNLPSLEVADLGINYTTEEIWAATYGRGMWKSFKLGYVAPPAPPVDTIKNITDTSADIYWNVVGTGNTYEYVVNNNPFPPASGTGTSGTFYHVGSLAQGTKYFVHLRTIGSVKKSVWITDNFTTKTLGIENVQQNGWGVIVYPNPVTNMLTLKIPAPYSGRGLLSITDLTGKLINNIPVTNNILELDMSGYKSGMYILKYTNGAYAQTLRVTKQ